MKIITLEHRIDSNRKDVDGSIVSIPMGLYDTETNECWLEYGILLGIFQHQNTGKIRYRSMVYVKSDGKLYDVEKFIGLSHIAEETFKVNIVDALYTKTSQLRDEMSVVHDFECLITNIMNHVGMLCESLLVRVIPLRFPSSSEFRKNLTQFAKAAIKMVTELPPKLVINNDNKIPGGESIKYGNSLILKFPDRNHIPGENTVGTVKDKPSPYVLTDEQVKEMLADMKSLADKYDTLRKLFKKLAEHRDMKLMVNEIGEKHGIKIQSTEGNSHLGDFSYPKEDEQKLISILDSYLIDRDDPQPPVNPVQPGNTGKGLEGLKATDSDKVVIGYHIAPPTTKWITDTNTKITTEDAKPILDELILDTPLYASAALIIGVRDLKENECFVSGMKQGETAYITSSHVPRKCVRCCAVTHINSVRTDPGMIYVGFDTLWRLYVKGLNTPCLGTVFAEQPNGFELIEI